MSQYSRLEACAIAIVNLTVDKRSNGIGNVIAYVKTSKTSAFRLPYTTLLLRNKLWDARVLLEVFVLLLEMHSNPSPFLGCLDRCTATIHDF